MEFALYFMGTLMIIAGGISGLWLVSNNNTVYGFAVMISAFVYGLIILGMADINKNLYVIVKLLSAEDDETEDSDD